MKSLIFQPLFLLGLAIRLALVFTVAAAPLTDWYLPFLDASSRVAHWDPWGQWLQQGGTPAAYPYGYVMWMAFLPFTLLCQLTDLPLAYGYGLTLLAADLALLGMLKRLIPSRPRLLLGVYWLSPIVIVPSYLMGFNDLVPVVFLTAALHYIRDTRLRSAGIACMAALSAKLSMVLVLPFFVIYLLHNRALRRFLPQFAAGITIGMGVFILPFLFSDGGLSMLFSNPEMDKIYLLSLDLGSSMVIYLVPLAYLLMLYAAWRVKRMNFELFHVLLGLAFLLVVLLTPAAPGWFIWTLPMLVAWQAGGDRTAIALTALFSLLFVVSALLVSPYHAAWISALHPPATALPSGTLGSRFPGLIHTALVATGLILATRIWRESVSRNDYFRLSQKPFVIGVAGDSGSGKDTFAHAMMGLFGQHSVTQISGDDYHRWDRQKPMWRRMTHLNPMANDLEGFANDLVALADRRPIRSRHYDHNTGKMGRPIPLASNDLIIASGLHALYMPLLRDCYDLSIYLDIDEGLRRHFKMLRDVGQRGHSVDHVLAALDKRSPDAARFIHPQRAHADLILSLQPIHPRLLENATRDVPLRYKLVARSRHGLSERSLARVLVGVCGLHVDMETSPDTTEVQLTIEGETVAADIALAAKIISPRIFEFLDIQPQWQDGVLGLMQLITLSHINQALTRRFI